MIVPIHCFNANQSFKDLCLFNKDRVFVLGYA